ncbi:hypothetical protein ACLOJK_025827, partial [Asimina triloba]
MGLLDKLWDDTVAGPQPENGLSKLRKYSSMSAARPSTIVTDEPPPLSRSISIPKPPSFRNVSAETGSLPSSPAGLGTPVSPFTQDSGRSRFILSLAGTLAARTPRGDSKKVRRKSTSEAFDRPEPRSPTVYD